MKKGLVQFTLLLILGNSVFSLWSISSIHSQNSINNLFVDKLELKTSDPDYWPTSGWRTSSPEEQGISLQNLNQMENYIDDENIWHYIDSLLIIRNGYLVYESYPSRLYHENKKHNIYSSTKAFSSALIGIALEEGYINGIDDRVINYFPNKTIDNLDSRKQAITIRHLLTMTSGLEWDDNVNYPEMTRTSDWVQYILDCPMSHQPGMEWNYNSGGSHLLSAILEQTTPNGTLAYANTHLFDPLNISNYLWSTDRQGIPIGGTLLSLTPRDMAKFGFLYLNNGCWNGTQLIPSRWVADSRKSFTYLQFEENQGAGYGYQWWIYKWANAYAAIGANKQYIMVIPDLNLVLAVNCNTDFPFINIVVDYILPAAGFSQINLGLVICLVVVSSSAIGAFLFFMYYQLHRKKILPKGNSKIPGSKKINSDI